MAEYVGQVPHILVVEDSPEDSQLVIEGFREVGREVRFTILEEGDDALAFLRREGRHRAAQRPDLIVLDLNLPRKSGHEVLAQVKTEPHLKEIPVIVLTTSSGKSDIARSYELHANCYIVKPLDLDAFMDAIRDIERFWLNLVRLPSREAEARA
jgi:two-component system, chemotaxis family, response regulator Rcp1